MKLLAAKLFRCRARVARSDWFVRSSGGDKDHAVLEIAAQP
jgi:hypothetical protein